MRQLKNILWAFSLGLVFYACGQEDELTPSNTIKNYFEIPEGAKDQVSLLRKEFQKKNGAYLLFNDTLRKELLGMSTENEPIYFVETVDLSYNFITSSQDKYEFEYFVEHEDREKAVAFIEKNILPVMDKTIYPYSFLLTDKIIKNTYLSESDHFEGDYETEEIEVQAGYRCLALALGNVLDSSVDDQKEYVVTVFRNLLLNKLMLQENTTLASFFAIGEQYYNKKYFNGEFEIEDLEDLRELGFLGGSIDSYWGEVFFPTKRKELEYFINALFSFDEEEFESENEDYPLVITKYKMLKTIVQEMGYHLELLTLN